MRVDIIDNEKALRALAANWDAVYEADPEAHFYLSFIWMAQWLAWLNRPWFVLAARPAEEERYVAFFPLWVETKELKSGGFCNSFFMGGNNTADYTGFICLPAHEEQAIPAFADSLQQLNWATLRIEFLRASERRTRLFLDAFPADAFKRSELKRVDKDGIDSSRCPFIRLPGDWEAYLTGCLSANSRQKFRRLLRRVETSGEFRITHADAATIDRDLGIVLDLWTTRWRPQKGAGIDTIVKNYRAMLHHAFRSGALFLPMLWQGERSLGGLAILVDTRKKSLLFFLAGRDETFEDMPSGLALHAHAIRHAIRNGFEIYDFLRGNEPYKYNFGVEERRIASFVLSTKDDANLGGRLDRRSRLDFVVERTQEHHRAGRNVEAEAGFRQILALAPDNADALYGLGQILAKSGEHAEAIGLLRRLLGRRPDLVRGWFWLGRSLRVGGDFWEAVRAYCEGIERQPAPAGAYYDLGHMLLQLRQADLAVAAFDAAHDLQPDLPDLAASRARALRQRSALSSEEFAQLAADHAELCARVARLGAIAAVMDRDLRTALAGPPAPVDHDDARVS